MKVLHVVESFNGQAIERWLIQMLDELNRQGEQVNWNFFCTQDEPGKYASMVTSIGQKVICSRYSVSKPLLFLKGLRHVVKEGDYDVVHCHHDIMGAFYLLALIGLPVRKRIIHVHNTSLPLPTSNRYKVKIGRFLLKVIGRFLADHIIGVSQPALEAYPGSGWMSRFTKSAIIHCGIGFDESSRANISEKDFIRKLDIPSGSKVLLFVGRMVEYKNPCFVLGVLEQLLAKQNNVYAVFAGTGPLEDAVRALAGEKGITDRVRVLGWRDDVPSIMQACDLLIWPGVEEPMEGLGLGVVEAQAAGLKVLMSRNVPKEAIIIPELVDVVPLSAGAAVWASEVMKMLGGKCIARKDALQRVADSSFSVSRSASNIHELYDSR